VPLPNFFQQFLLDASLVDVASTAAACNLSPTSAATTYCCGYNPTFDQEDYQNVQVLHHFNLLLHQYFDQLVMLLYIELSHALN
jgi:hypothetical protein